MPWVNEKLIRLLLVAVGLSALGAFGLEVKRFLTDRASFFPVVDLRGIEESAGVVARNDRGHLLPYEDYRVVQDLNVTGYVPPPEAGELPPTPVATALSPNDLQVVYVQYVAPDSPANAAWIQSPGEQATPESVPGDLYRVGDVVPVPNRAGLEVRVAAIRPGTVVVAWGSDEDGGELELSVPVDPTSPEEILGGEGAALVAAESRPRSAPPVTVQDERGDFVVGTRDAEYFESLSEEELVTSVPVRPARDPLSNEVRGLRIQSVPPGTPFERLGLRPGDVVLSVGGTPARSRDQLLQAMRDFQGDVIEVQVERLGAVRTLRYRLPRR